MNEDLPIQGNTQRSQRSFMDQSIAIGQSSSVINDHQGPVSSRKTVRESVIGSQICKFFSSYLPLALESDNADSKSIMSTTSGLKKKAAAKTKKKTGTTANPVNATEVFSWGSDLNGQLGLGLMGGNSNTLQPTPKYCTYGITIKEIACGEDHSAFITQDNFLYSIGNNQYGQLGIGDSSVKFKNSPTLVETFVNNEEAKGVLSVACGNGHTIISSLTGHVYSWGDSRNGALGLGSVAANQYSPLKVSFEGAESPNIVQISAGKSHSLALDGFGRVYSFGSNQEGQLGVPGRALEQVPVLIPNFNDMAQMVAAGN